MTLLDLTEDTVTAEKLLKGETAHGKDGSPIVGTLEVGGGGSAASASQNDVTFYDYDGTIVASYSLAEAQELTALPEGPAHPGLTFQGWNRSLEKVKALTRPMNIGAMYVTDDGKTKLNIRVWDKTRSNVPLHFSQTVSNGVTIDWGDGSPAEILPGTGNVNTAHQYAETGEYTISLVVAEGCELRLGWNNSSYCVMGSTGNNGMVYCNLLQSAHIGERVSKIGNDAFRFCYSLASITIPDGVTSIGDYAFWNCYSLARITIPDGVTSINAGAFQNCYGIAEYHLKPATPPTLYNTKVFNGIPADCIIYVPQGCLEAYQAATNWAAYADYMREEAA